MASLPLDFENRVQAEIRPGECLLWCGQPHPDSWARKSFRTVLFGIVLSIVPSALTVGSLVAVWNEPRRFFDPGMICFFILIQPFLLLGLLCVSAPYWQRRWARRTCYAVTDRRVLAWTPVLGGIELRTHDRDGLKLLARRVYDDGSGDLIFEERVQPGRNDSVQHTEWGLLDIDQPREVETLLRQMPCSTADGSR